MLHIAFAPIYRYELPEGHRFPMVKYELIAEQLLYEGIVREAQLFHPQRLEESIALQTHSTSYWDKLTNLTLTKSEERAIGFPINQHFIERGRYISGGTVQCVTYALQYGISMNVAGGTHHAFRDRGEGFCCLNDQAVAANWLLSQDPSQKILIIDLDVHQGNGTASIFQGEPRVFTFSMHGAKNYPLRKEKSNLDLDLPDGLTDQPYLAMLNKQLPLIAEQFQPSFIFYQSGVDILETDKLGRLNITRDGCKKRDQLVFDFCKKNNLPIVVSMGGGYSPKLADIVDAHVNTFKAAQEIFF
jgi:acetoin utilization deacetylase AcuC-like enzyme